MTTLAANDPTADHSAPRPSPAAGGPPAGPPGFALLGEIGRGGMGAVYRARDLALDREVAVKLLQDQFAPGSGAARRFVDEARITAQLQHPGIPPVYHVGTAADGRPFLAMKLIKGDTLDDLLRRGDPLDRLAVFAAVAQAVGYAHARGVIHRDLKPANVMVGAFGEVQVMDWGLAKVVGRPDRDGPDGDPLATAPAGTVVTSRRDADTPFTEYGSAVGTPAFMPPEQAAGELDQVGPASDVFGLGAVLCVLLTGRPPFTGRSAEDVRIAAVRGETAAALARLDESGADPDVVGLCKRCLAVRPADRPADAGAVAAEAARLRAAADDRARRAEVLAGQALVREAEARRRRQQGAAAGGLVLAATLAGGLVAGVQWRRAVAALEYAQSEEQAKTAALAESEGVVERFCNRVSEHPELRTVGLTHLRVELLQEAADHYKRIAAQRPGDPDAVRRAQNAEARLANILVGAGEWDTSLQILERQTAELEAQLAADPSDQGAIRRLSRVLQERCYRLITVRGADGALPLAERVMELVGRLSQPTRSEQAYAHENRGSVFEKLRRGAEAEAEYAAAYQLRVGPDSRPADDGSPRPAGVLGVSDLAALTAAVGTEVTVQGVVRTVRESQGRVLTHVQFTDGTRTGFTAVIGPQLRASFPADINQLYAGKVVRVRGEVGRYKGLPQIRLVNPADISLAADVRPTRTDPATK